MSYLTDNPDVMMEVLAVLVKRAGGSVKITSEEAPGAFDLMSRWNRDGSLDLMLTNGVSDSDVAALNATEKLS